MNRQLTRVAWAAMALIVALVIGTTYWQTWARPGLAARQDNEIQRVQEFQVKRGLILAPARVLARNRAVRRGGRTLYFRRYPQGRLAAHVVGYSTVSRARAGLEKSLNGVLTGTEGNLANLVERQLDDLRNEPIVGDTVVTTLDLPAQQVALEQLGRRCGAVTAIDPRSGKLLVMASSPSYNPNLVESDFGQIGAITADCRPAAPLVNRASQGLYPPGSIFKVVTASAALSSRRWEPSSTFVDPGYCIAYGKRVNNFDTSRPFGRIDLATALQYSVNSVFCNIGKALGAKRILDQAKKFGFYERPPLETPESERYPSGLYRNGDLWYPERNSDVDAGRMAFGQERMLVTPLQMAMVAGGIGNAGIVMRPFVVEKLVSPKGPDGRPHAPRAARSRRRAGRRTRRPGHDGAGGPERHGHRRADSRLPHRRQDGHGRDGGRRPEHDLVHRLRRAARRAARGGDRGRAREPVPDGRGDGGADRPRGDGGTPASGGESVAEAASTLRMTP